MALDIYSRRDSDSGEVMGKSNVLSILVDVSNELAVDERVYRSSEILDPAGVVIYAIRGGESEPYIDLTEDYPDQLPNPFKD